MPDEHAELEIITRRTLLAAGTGLLVSDSGLLLPEWYLPDAEAREGANGERLGGRRGRNRRGRDKSKHRRYQGGKQ